MVLPRRFSKQARILPQIAEREHLSDFSLFCSAHASVTVNNSISAREPITYGARPKFEGIYSMRRAIAAAFIATVAVGAVHRVLWHGLGWFAVSQVPILLGIGLTTITLFVMAPNLETRGLWPSMRAPVSFLNSFIGWSGTCVVGLLVAAWTLGSDGLWLLIADDNSAWLRISSTSTFGHVAPVDHGVATAVVLGFAVGVTRLVFQLYGATGHPWEIYLWSVVGTYAALILILPTLAQRALTRRLGQNTGFPFSHILVQVSMATFAIEAIRFGHLTALLLCVGLIGSLPSPDELCGERYRVARWIPFACCLSIWLGTAPLSLSLLGGIIVASFVPWKTAQLLATVLGGMVAVLIGHQFAVLLPWGGSVVEVHWLTIAVVVFLMCVATKRHNRIPPTLTILISYVSVLAIINLSRSGSIDYGVSKVVWILLPIVFIELFALLEALMNPSVARKDKDRCRGCIQNQGIWVVVLATTAVVWMAIPTIENGLPFERGNHESPTLHWRDLGANEVRSVLPSHPVGCFGIDTRKRPALTSEPLYRCNRFVTSMSYASAQEDDRISRVFREYSLGGTGPGSVLAELGHLGIHPARVLIIDTKGQISATTLVELVSTGAT